MELSYDVLEEEVFRTLGNNKIMVLATCSDNRVTARNMSCLIYNKRIYFQTDKSFVKYEQMDQNPNVALCVNNIQMEGCASLKNQTLLEPEFVALYQQIYKTSYDAYSHMKNSLVVEVIPSFITLWNYEDGQPYRDFIDLKNKIATREIYDTSI